MLEYPLKKDWITKANEDLQGKSFKSSYMIVCRFVNSLTIQID